MMSATMRAGSGRGSFNNRLWPLWQVSSLLIIPLVTIILQAKLLYSNQQSLYDYYSSSLPLSRQKDNNPRRRDLEYLLLPQVKEEQDWCAADDGSKGKGDLVFLSSHLENLTAYHPSEPPGWGYNHLLELETKTYGNLQQLQCLCGCSSNSTSTSTTSSRISCFLGHDRRTARMCLLENVHYYESGSNSSANKFPVLLALCTPTEVRSDGSSIFSPNTKGSSFWSSLNAFGGSHFGHIDHPIPKIAVLDPDTIQLLPRTLEFDHAKTTSTRGRSGKNISNKEASGKSSPQWRVTEARPSVTDLTQDFNTTTTRTLPAEESNHPDVQYYKQRESDKPAPLVYYHSGDCVFMIRNNKSEINPWHCNAVWVNMIIFTNLLLQRHSNIMTNFMPSIPPMQSSKNIDMWSVAGDRGFGRHKQSGWLEMKLAAGGTFYTGFGKPDPIHTTVATYRHSFTNVVTNPNPIDSPLWNWLQEAKRPQMTGSSRPSAVFGDIRKRMITSLETELRKRERHPLEQLVRHAQVDDQFWHIHTPPDMDLDATDDLALLKGFFYYDMKRFESSPSSWTPRILPKFVLFASRAPLPSSGNNNTEINVPLSCKRCLTNSAEVASALAKQLDAVVIRIRLTMEIDPVLQAYLYLSSHLIVGMHGGSWGNAMIVGEGQAAVEITHMDPPILSKHIVEQGGGAYRNVRCAECCKNKKTFTGRVEVGPVVVAAREALCVAQQRARLISEEREEMLLLVVKTASQGNVSL